MTELKYRSQAADVTKGIAIMVIVLAHSQLRKEIDPLVVALGLVAIPLFFFLSGVFLNPKYTFWQFFLKKTDIILKPYFVTLFLYGLVMHAFYIRQYPVSDWQGALYATGQSNPWVWVPMWFLPITWLTLICAFALIKYFRFSDWPWYFKSLLLLGCYFIGAFYIDFFWKQSFNISDKRYFIMGLPFSIDLLPLSLSFILLGIILKEKVKTFIPPLASVALAGIVFISLVVIYEIKLDMNRRTFINPEIAVFAIISGAYFIFGIAHLITLKPAVAKLLITVGRASLFILIFHFIIYQGFADYLKAHYWRQFDMFYYSLAAYPISIIIPILIKKIAERITLLKYLYLPVVK